MDYSNLSTLDLVGRFVGVREAKKLYRGSLHPLFVPSSIASPSHEKFAAAKELVKRWLVEEIKRENVLQHPAAVRDFLRLHFAGREHESFVTLLLDSQNRLIAA